MNLFQKLAAQDILLQRVQKAELINKVSKNRSRERRLRSQNNTSSRSGAVGAAESYEHQKPQMLAAKSTSSVNNGKSVQEGETGKKTEELKNSNEN